ncbi:MAG: sodium:alanine symporter family protein [Oscillospiraceae bacterium]|nr:sodium:alanine symporter family protein [Oscillospiraceae bacterium]
MTRVIDTINQIVWGIPALVLIIGVGLYLSVGTGWVQFRLFPQALKQLLGQFRRKDDVSSRSGYRALCTALAATVGTGNLAGVAGAIAIGGPGSIFWMWICGILGMTTKFAEATLAIQYRCTDAGGSPIGGPMYMISRGMGAKWKPLAVIYCIFGLTAAFGVGSATQINAVIGGINSALQELGVQHSRKLDLMMGAVFAVLALLVLFGGADRIGGFAERLIPFASMGYLILCVGVLLIRFNAVPSAFLAIVKGAWNPKAVTGGILGSFFSALRVGASRGVFTNEAGMGTAAIAHAGAQVDHPVQQGMMGILEVFLDTIVICTLTALVILCSGAPIPYGQDLGIVITADSFSVVYGPWVKIVIALFLCLFAFATIIGWGMYGGRCAQFLFGLGAWRWFAVLLTLSIFMGAVVQTGTVWIISETVNGLMSIPNLIMLLYLSPELFRLTHTYRSDRGSETAFGGTYEDFNQCKPLRTVSYAKIPPSGGEG